MSTLPHLTCLSVSSLALRPARSAGSKAQHAFHAWLRCHLLQSLQACTAPLKSCVWVHATRSRRSECQAAQAHLPLADNRECTVWNYCFCDGGCAGNTVDRGTCELRNQPNAFYPRHATISCQACLGWARAGVTSQKFQHSCKRSHAKHISEAQCKAVRFSRL